jgi:hypothetical protein
MVEGCTFSGIVADEVVKETSVPDFLDWYCVVYDESAAEKSGTEDYLISIFVSRHAGHCFSSLIGGARDHAKSERIVDYIGSNLFI